MGVHHRLRLSTFGRCRWRLSKSPLRKAATPKVFKKYHLWARARPLSGPEQAPPRGRTRDRSGTLVSAQARLLLAMAFSGSSIRAMRATVSRVAAVQTGIIVCAHLAADANEIDRKHFAASGNSGFDNRSASAAISSLSCRRRASASVRLPPSFQA